MNPANTKAVLALRPFGLIILTLVAGLTCTILGQNANTGEIRGVVTDMSGAAMPGVNVTIRHRK